MKQSTELEHYILEIVMLATIITSRYVNGM